MEIQIPEKVQYVINKLIENGFEAYAVGGCVRDTILGRNPEDWDITTSAKPEEVKKLFRRTINTGIQHGTVTVMLDKEGFEVTTYRIDGEYEDNRHPKSVEFTTNLEEDLKRRDFTINAMAYNQIEGLVDKFHGMEDLKKGRISCVGNPEDRFDEDALRMLRAVRFSGQLGFQIDGSTREAIIKKAGNLDKISAERIRTELNKLLISQGADQLKEAYLTGMTKIILPEFDQMCETNQNNPHHIYSVGEHSLKAVQEISTLYQQEASYDERIHSILCWTMLLHDVAKPIQKTTGEDGIDHFYGHQDKGVAMSEKILKRLKFDNYTIDMVCRLIKWHDYRFTLTSSAIRKAVNKMGEDLIRLLFLVERADMKAQNPSTFREKDEIIKGAEILYDEIERAAECINLKSLAVHGKDLMELGLPAGKEIGRILNSLLEQVLEDPHLNKKEILLELVKQMIP